jgi:hypothetical protein
MWESGEGKGQSRFFASLRMTSGEAGAKLLSPHGLQ